MTATRHSGPILAALRGHIQLMRADEQYEIAIEDATAFGIRETMRARSLARVRVWLWWTCVVLVVLAIGQCVGGGA